MADLTFLHPRDLVTIYGQEFDGEAQQRSHVVGCGEINGLLVMSDFYAFLAKRGIVPEVMKTVAPIEAARQGDVPAEDSDDKEFYVSCPAGKIHELLLDWSEEWRAEHGYGE